MSGIPTSTSPNQQPIPASEQQQGQQQQQQPQYISYHQSPQLQFQRQDQQQQLLQQQYSSSSSVMAAPTLVLQPNLSNSTGSNAFISQMAERTSHYQQQPQQPQQQSSQFAFHTPPTPVGPTYAPQQPQNSHQQPMNPLDYRLEKLWESVGSNSYPAHQERSYAGADSNPYTTQPNPIPGLPAYFANQPSVVSSPPISASANTPYQQNNTLSSEALAMAHQQQFQIAAAAAAAAAVSPHINQQHPQQSIGNPQQALEEWSMQGGWTRAPFHSGETHHPGHTRSYSAPFPQSHLVNATPSPMQDPIHKVIQPGNSYDVMGRMNGGSSISSADITPVSSPQVLQNSAAVASPPSLGNSSKATSKKRSRSESASVPGTKKSKSTVSAEGEASGSTSVSSPPNPPTSLKQSTRRLPIIPAAIVAAAASVGMNMSDEELAAASVIEKDGQRRFACPFDKCNKIFSTSGHLSRHIKGHSGAKPFSCPIPGCTSKFSRHDNMMQHYRSHTRRVASPFQYGSPAFFSSIYRPNLLHPMGQQGIPSTSPMMTPHYDANTGAPGMLPPGIYNPGQPLPNVHNIRPMIPSGSPSLVTSTSSSSSVQSSSNTSPFMNANPAVRPDGADAAMMLQNLGVLKGPEDGKI
ncbi:hypothetical protein HDU97_008006 [Phlyctochytrium planicorne]|nr:hypothetical protein HDU97_008006 [Phlyctochytrium planicorne]